LNDRQLLALREKIKEMEEILKEDLEGTRLIGNLLEILQSLVEKKLGARVWRKYLET